MRRRWQEEELQLLTELYEGGVPVATIAKRLTRRASSVRSQICQLGLVRQTGEIHKAWTIDETALFRELWKSATPVAEISEMLGRTPAALHTRARELRLGRKGRAVKEKQVKTPAPRRHKRKVTDHEKEKLLQFWESFYRVYALAERRNIAVSKASLFEPFLMAYGTEMRRLREGRSKREC